MGMASLLYFLNEKQAIPNNIGIMTPNKFKKSDIKEGIAKLDIDKEVLIIKIINIKYVIVFKNKRQYLVEIYINPKNRKMDENIKSKANIKFKLRLMSNFIKNNIFVIINRII